MIALYSLILVWNVLFNRQSFICILITEKEFILEQQNLQVTKWWEWLLPPAPFQSRGLLHCHCSEPTFCSWCEHWRSLAAPNAISKLLQRSRSHFSLCLKSSFAGSGWPRDLGWTLEERRESLALVLEK